jgi:hypothetical protein
MWMTYKVPAELQSCALHTNDDSGIVPALRHAISCQIGFFKVDNGYLITSAGKHKCLIETQSDGPTIKVQVDDLPDTKQEQEQEQEQSLHVDEETPKENVEASHDAQTTDDPVQRRDETRAVDSGAKRPRGRPRLHG